MRRAARLILVPAFACVGAYAMALWAVLVGPTANDAAPWVQTAAVLCALSFLLCGLVYALAPLLDRPQPRRPWARHPWRCRCSSCR